MPCLEELFCSHFSAHYDCEGTTPLLTCWSPFSVVTGVLSPPPAMKIISFLFALLLVVFHGAAGKL